MTALTIEKEAAQVAHSIIGEEVAAASLPTAGETIHAFASARKVAAPAHAHLAPS